MLALNDSREGWRESSRCHMRRFGPCGTSSTAWNVENQLRPRGCEGVVVDLDPEGGPRPWLFSIEGARRLRVAVDGTTSAQGVIMPGHMETCHRPASQVIEAGECAISFWACSRASHRSRLVPPAPRDPSCTTCMSVQLKEKKIR